MSLAEILRVNITKIILIIHSDACGISIADKYVVTGGWGGWNSPDGALKTVTRYNKTGDTETLPQLIFGRYQHACGSYLSEQGENVRFILLVRSSKLQL